MNTRPRGQNRRAPDKTPDRIAGMFDAIAPRYDLLNHLLSAGIDRRWRTKMIASLNLTGRETLIDVCTGTADVALEARAAHRGRNGARVLGVDFAGAMLALGLEKIRRAGRSAAHRARSRGCDANSRLPTASLTRPPFAFGVRNVQRPEVACAEMARVLGREAAWRSSSSACRVFRRPARALPLVFHGGCCRSIGRASPVTRGVFVSARLGRRVSSAGEFVTLLRHRALRTSAPSR